MDEFVRPIDGRSSVAATKTNLTGAIRSAGDHCLRWRYFFVLTTMQDARGAAERCLAGPLCANRNQIFLQYCWLYSVQILGLSEVL